MTKIRTLLGHATCLRFVWGLLATGCFAAHGQDGYYAGHCADGRGMQFVLTGGSTNPAISLRVEGTGSGPLQFKTNGAGRLEFCGFDGEDDGARWPVFGLWLAVSNLPATASGVLFLQPRTNALSFTAARVASQASFSRKRGLHLWGRGGGKEFSAAWPDFQDGVPFHRSLSQLLAAEARGETGEFTAGAHGVIWDGLKAGGGVYDWEGSLDTEIAWLGTNLVSLFQLRYEYTGGAHGMSSAIGRNFILAGGKAREFSLEELFLPGTDWIGALSSACLRELRRQHASWVMPETEPAFRVKSFDAKYLTAFNVDRYGLMIHFDPYAVGPYAEGMFHVFVPWSELRALLDPKGPAAQFGNALW